MLSTRLDNRRRAAAFTLVEMIVIIAVIGVMAVIALPSFQRIRTSAALQSGRAAATSTLAAARATATAWGRTAVVRIDGPGNALWAVVDTGAAGNGVDTMVVGRVDLGGDLGLDLRSDRTTLCFNSRGVGTVARECPETGATLVLRYGNVADTLWVNVAGRVWR